MPAAPTESLWDAYIFMLEKSPATTIMFTGIILLLSLAFFLFAVLASSGGLRTFLREVVKGVRYSEGKLAYDGSPKADEVVVQTDEKGNVKPPAGPSEPEEGPQEYSPENDQFFCIFKMRYAWEETLHPLTKVLEYYERAKKASGPFPAPFIEAEYLLARFRCGDASALITLKAKAGASPEAYAANGTLANYYRSIGERDEALKCLENRFQHAPDSARKLHSARALATLLVEIGKWESSVALLKDQLSYFQSSPDQAELWEEIGTIYKAKNLFWRSRLCFEKALKLNPDNTDLRFSLAYSYGEQDFGKTMAVHHYRILLEQRPGYSIATNNLSVIYDEIGAASKKISLLRGAVGRKDNSYVAANLATAYARAGFIDDARGYLLDIPADEQQESIVRGAHRNIREQIEADEELSKKLEQLMNLEKSIIYDSGLHQIGEQEDELFGKLVGEWLVPGESRYRLKNMTAN
jgi:tetratricopeptide (TPR) repeat protein